jgi:hypothetical protein
MTKKGTLWFGLMVIVLIALLVALGCDTSKTGRVGQKLVFDPKNPCNILTKDEVEAVIKQKVKDPQPQNYACTYESVDSKKFTSLIFSLEATDAAGLFKGMRDHFEKSGKPVKQVAGVGAGAFFYERELHILKGNYFFHFLSSGNEGYELNEDAIRTLAKTAVDKL